MASHEFLTPLAVNLSSAEFIRDYGRRTPPADQQKGIGTTENGARRMRQMLDRGLLLGTAAAHKLKLHHARSICPACAKAW
ncbi:MAG: hypothetical protein H7274_19375 [Rhodoferax sp.]|nr:hypothetical protein [Rhodoferax sp.]